MAHATGSGAVAGSRRLRSSLRAVGLGVVAGVVLALAVHLAAEPGGLRQRSAIGVEPESVECAWDSGFTWADLDGSAVAMAVFDDGSGPALYVGGHFPTASGVVVNHVARWDGSAWAPLAGPSGAGMDLGVWALAVFDDGSGPALYAGGNFYTAGGVAASKIAKWDGVTWSPLGSGMANADGLGVHDLAVFDDGSGPALYAAGAFGTAGGVTVNHVARWDGSSWSPLVGPGGPGVGGVGDVARALAVYDDGAGPALFVGGSFVWVGGVQVNRVARWDGSTWSPLGTGLGADSQMVYDLAVFDDGAGAALFAGGSFTTADGTPASRVARWNGAEWSAPSGIGVSDTVAVLQALDDGAGPALYAGGEFLTAGSLTVNRVARWDGSAWSGLQGPSGTGVDGSVGSLAVFDDGTGDALYVGGSQRYAGGVPAHGIARWSADAWSSLSSPSGGLGWRSRALAVFGPALYVGGSFTTAGDLGASYVARWDGLTWTPLGTGVDSDVNALAVFDDGSGPALYAGGWFTTAGGVTVNRVARWDGAAWSPLSGPSGPGCGEDARCRPCGLRRRLGAGALRRRRLRHGRRCARQQHRALGRQRLVTPCRRLGIGVSSSVQGLVVFDDGRVRRSTPVAGSAAPGGLNATTSRAGMAANGLRSWAVRHRRQRCRGRP